jgi:Ca-activated chloride channel family protein
MMNHRTWLFLIGTAFLGTAAIALARPAPALADGMIIIDPHHVILPHPRPIPPRVVYMPLNIKYHRVKAEITNTVAVTRIDQAFANPNPRVLEGTYIFPLADDVAVQRFSMFMDGKEVKGELLDKDKARQIYEDYVRKMKDPALLEYVGSRMFKARVFPIPANGEVRITLDYTQAIPVKSGLATYRYPLNTEKFSPKPLEEVTVMATITSDVSLSNVFCPTHPVRIDRKGPGEVVVSYEAKSVTPDEDFVVYYNLSKTEFGLSLLTHRTSGEDGFFMARLAPGITEPGKVIPKDVCFIIDVSGSMAGPKIEQARKALKFCLSNLNQGDRFNVISFSTEPRAFNDRLVPASSEQVNKARDQVDQLQAIGGTDINDALLMALKMATGDAKRPYLIVFMTDGEPTIGVTDVPQILKNVAEANKQKVRIFVLGVGSKVNTRLLDRLADDNHGNRDYVTEKEDLEIKLSNFYTALANPVLSDPQLAFDGVTVHDVYPRKLPDLFKGSEIVVFGQYSGSGEGAVRLTGKRSDDHMTFVYKKDFPPSQSANEFIPRLWAMAKIGYLMDEIRLHGSNQELKDEVVRLSKKYGIMTELTSWLVLEEDRARPTAVASPAPLREALNAPGRLGMAAKAGTGFRYERGAESVDASRQIILHQQAGNLQGNDEFLRRAANQLRDNKGQLAMQNVGARTFYRQGNQWVDSRQAMGEKDKLPTVRVALYSKEYFDLVRKHPEASKYFALGPEVVVVLGDKAYETYEP